MLLGWPCAVTLVHTDLKPDAACSFRTDGTHRKVGLSHRLHRTFVREFYFALLKGRHGDCSSSGGDGACRIAELMLHYRESVDGRQIPHWRYGPHRA